MGRIESTVRPVPTEIMVIADEGGRPGAGGGRSHQPGRTRCGRRPILVTDSADLISRVEEELVGQIALTKHSERICRPWPVSKVPPCWSIPSDAVVLANIYGPNTSRSRQRPPQTGTADPQCGAIFVGEALLARLARGLRGPDFQSRSPRPGLRMPFRAVGPDVPAGRATDRVLAAALAEIAPQSC